LHSAGSFFYVYFLCWWLKLISNEKFNKSVYDYVVGGSMIAYVMHYLWIVIVVNKFVRPYKMDWQAGFTTAFIGTEICIFLFHYFVVFVQKFMGKGKPKRQRLPSDSGDTTVS